ncbi:oxidoreductase [Altererythrobacter indicus]|uniref:Oxidoreductase n=1 Tax=Altericroceibacterium indicum TaxID=374177 RepID=A0A845ABI6_9SPHN|nr:Ldh family oxidoreductase [Altericroceibacterium indicum]MXP27054.1 oxidoreductase [Altericroceibacterium indicum]
MSAGETVHLTLDEVRALAKAGLAKTGLSPDHVDAVAETMVSGERDGCASHGIYRLLVAASSVKSGVVVPDAVPELSEPSPALVRVDGKGGFAQLPFRLGAPLLAEKARKFGIAAMGLNNVVHFAALWPEVEELTRQGLVALAVTPSHAWVAPAGGTKPVFGTNPIAFGWPRSSGEPFIFDFATSAVARGEIELHRRAGKPVPDDWGYNADGHATTVAEEVLSGAMRTFGGHKGSALAAMVELLGGPLIGDMTSLQSIEADGGRGGSPIGGEFIIAIDPAGFVGDLLAEYMKHAEVMFETITGQGARLPSQRRYEARKKSLVQGVEIPAALMRDIEKLLEES